MGTSQVRWNGAARTTTFVNAGQVTAAIPASDIVTQGSAQVTVVNPAPGGETLNVLSFTISAPANLVPALTSLAPTSTPAGGPAFTLTVNGSNFVGTSQVRWNGAARTTTLVNAGQVTAAIPASDIVTPGSAQVTVVTLTSDWTFCAAEDGVCAFTGTEEVRYGANGSYFYKTLTDGTACTNSVFGDPISGTAKHCAIRMTAASNVVAVHHRRAGEPGTHVARPDEHAGRGGRVHADGEREQFRGDLPSPLERHRADDDGGERGPGDGGDPGERHRHPGERAGDGGESDQRLDGLRGGRRRVRIYRHRGGALRGQRVVFLQESDRRDRLHQQRVRRRSDLRHRETLRYQDDGCLERLDVHHQRGDEPGAGAHLARPDEHAGRGGRVHADGEREQFRGDLPSPLERRPADDDVCQRGPGNGGDSGERHRHRGERAGDGGDSGARRGTSNAVSFTISAAANPVPALTSLAPTSTPAGGAGFTLTVNGSNFVGTSQVRWNGTGRTTTFVNAGQVTAAIPASDIVTQGSAQVTVVNPTSDWTFCAAEFGVCAFTGTEEVRYGANGSYFYKSLTDGTACTNSVFGDPIFGTAKHCALRTTAASNVLTFTISAAANPVPALTSLAPTSTPAGGAGFTLTVNGSNFVGTSQVRWNGAARTTTFVNAGQVTAAIPASDIVTAGKRAGDGGDSGARRGTSNAVSFTISAAANPVPALTSLAPTSTPAGGPASR